MIARHNVPLVTLVVGAVMVQYMSDANWNLQFVNMHGANLSKQATGTHLSAGVYLLIQVLYSMNQSIFFSQELLIFF